ncbi:MAG: glycosyltransferase [Bacteroidota bacterium]|nr:glycosyltransferase [Bacteroidota bacterium]
MSKKIIKVVVTNDLHTDQRVHKVCFSLLKHGFEPQLTGIFRPFSQPIKRIYHTERFEMRFQKTALFYAEYNIKLFFKLLFGKFDIILSNDTDTLPAAFLAARLKKKPIVFDAHELFTEVPELVHRPVIKRVWKSFEDVILPKIKYAYTVCQPIADIYNKRYGLKMGVVRNAPLTRNSSIKTPKRFTFEGKKMLLYQGAVNVGRGLEWVIDAMPYLNNVVFCIAGDGDITQEITDRILRLGLQDKVLMMGKIPFEELYNYTISADLGISLLENRGLNYYYSLPNRIFDFVQAQVPVLATDFPEIRNVVEAYQIGTLIDHYEPQYLAGVIQNMLSEWENKPDKKAIFEKAQADLCWEKDEETLIGIFNSIQ